ncbi:A24 family peptidase [Trinickia fusca]|uniref:Peptidase A24 n=1 Tax=Trinickia fusca TaxID=2419777 RepID=A0A494XNR8_9BURK|nr:prepilin peptidase [Trinickia fusca]RKP52307.1 peptidase A24 [Trinickia fusca]
MLHLVQLATSLVFVLLAAYDLRFRRLPNPFVVAVVVLYVVAAPLAHTSLVSFAQHLATAALAFVLSALMFRLGWIGAGDAKLAAAVFLWAGPSFAVSALLLTGVGGFVLALAVLAHRHTLLVRPSRAGEVPYGIALALAGTAAVWASFAAPAPAPVL